MHWFGNFLKDFLDPKALVQDRIHAFLWFACLWALNYWRKKMSAGIKQSIATVALAGLTLFVVVSLIAGLKTARPDVEHLPKMYVRHALRGIYGEDKNSTLLTFVLRIKNSEMPTVAWNWQLTTIFPSGERTISQIEPYQPEIGMNFHDGDMSDATMAMIAKQITKDNYLPWMLFQHPMDAWGAREGWVRFGLDKIQLSQVLPGTVFIIEFEDSRGNKVTVKHPWTARVTNLPR